jgi:hypothetical protein
VTTTGVTSVPFRRIVAAVNRGVTVCEGSPNCVRPRFHRTKGNDATLSDALIRLDDLLSRFSGESVREVLDNLRDRKEVAMALPQSERGVTQEEGARPLFFQPLHLAHVA